jgi:hypothetical protein
MMAPETLAQSQARQVTDVIRVALERRGVIGFIETHDGMTLVEARALIWENVEDAPQEFQFVLDDGAPVSARQETTQRIASFYPMVKIRECRRSRTAPTASPPRPPLLRSNSAARDGEPSSGSASLLTASSEKVCVVTASGDEFHTWIVEDYTFQQLRRDAARYWHLPASQVALTDADGCLWPEQAKILSVMGIAELHERKIILEYKAGALARGSDAAFGRRKSQTGLLHRSQSLSASLSTSPVSVTLARTASARRLRSATSEQPLASHGDALGRHRIVDSPIEELWRIFTFYCVNGDSMELECIKAHQFNKLLRDARVFSGSLTPAMVDIIYMSETKGKPQSSAKMSYNEFLNALVKVANALHHTRGAGSKHLRDAEDEDAHFQKLVTEHILPRASRWPTHLWDEHTQRLRKPEVVAFISKFLEPLLEMFMFYARSHAVHPATGVKEFYMSYADYQRFVNDFAFANLQLSSVEAAQVFIASCSSPPFHAPLFAPSAGEADASESPSLDSEALDAGLPLSLLVPMSAESSGNGSSGPAGSFVATIQRVLESVEGIVAYTFPENQVGKMCMGVSAFLDSLGRTGLAAFSKTRPLKTIHCVKGVFHHLSRGLTRSRVLEILRNHGPTSMRATKFYSGTVAFNNKFLDMWRYEGSPDYLTGDMLNVSGSVAPSKLGGVASGSGGAINSVPGTASRQASDKPVVAASQTLGVATSSSTALRRAPPLMTLDDRVTVAGSAGRGREALDRMVRNTFLRNAAAEAVGVQAPTASKTSSPLIADVDAVAAESTPGDLAIDSAGNAVEFSKSLSTIEGDEDDGCEVRSPALVGGDPNAPAAAEKKSEPPSSPSVGTGGHLTVVPPPAPLPRDDRSFYESVLLKGGVFKKYGQWGNPHRRFVWLARDSDTIFWRPVDKKNALVKEGVPVAAVVAVLPGNSTRTRYAFMKHLSEGKSRAGMFVYWASWRERERG